MVKAYSSLVIWKWPISAAGFIKIMTKFEVWEISEIPQQKLDKNKWYMQYLIERAASYNPDLVSLIC